MPGEQPRPEPTRDEQPINPELARSWLARGAEANVEQLDKDYVVKTLGNDDPKALELHRDNYKLAQELLPGRVARTLFVRGKDARGRVRNLMFQEKVTGDILYPDIGERLPADPELRNDLEKFFDELEAGIEQHYVLPDPNEVNYIVQHEGKPRIKLVDFGYEFDTDAWSKSAGDPTLLRDLFREARRQFSERSARGENGPLPLEMLVRSWKIVHETRVAQAGPDQVRTIVEKYTGFDIEAPELLRRIADAGAR